MGLFWVNYVIMYEIFLCPLIWRFYIFHGFRNVGRICNLRALLHLGTVEKLGKKCLVFFLAEEFFESFYSPCQGLEL